MKTISANTRYDFDTERRSVLPIKCPLRNKPVSFADCVSCEFYQGIAEKSYPEMSIRCSAIKLSTAQRKGDS